MSQTLHGRYHKIKSERHFVTRNNRSCQRVWGCIYLLSVFHGGTLELELDIGIFLVEIRNGISGEVGTETGFMASKGIPAVTVLTDQHAMTTRGRVT